MNLIYAAIKKNVLLTPVPQKIQTPCALSLPTKPTSLILSEEFCICGIPTTEWPLTFYTPRLQAIYDLIIEYIPKQNSENHYYLT